MSEISDVSKTETKQKQPYLNRNFLKILAFFAVVVIAVILITATLLVYKGRRIVQILAVGIAIGILITTVLLFLRRKKTAPVKIAFKLYESRLGSHHELSPVIFLHGLCSSNKSWKDIPKIVAEKTRRKIFVIDARNHGESDFTEEFSFDLNVDDLFTFMDTNNITKAILVGHSMGGITANLAALKKPDRIEMIFVEDVHLKRLSQIVIDSILQYIKITTDAVNSIPKGSIYADALKRVVDIVLEKMPILKKQGNHSREINYSSFTFIERKPDGTYSVPFHSTALLKAFEHPENLSEDPKGQFLGPSYFMYGDKSPMNVSLDIDNIVKHFPNAEFIVFEEGAHQLHSTQQDKFIKTILDRIPP